MMDSNKRKIEFSSGIDESNLPFHKTLPFLRKVFINKNIFINSNIHLAVHFINNIKDNIKHYSELHTHNVDEYNIIIGNNNGKGLKYKICTEGKEYIVESPQSIYIPAGIPHSAEVIEGSGVFICIVMKNKI